MNSAEKVNGITLPDLVTIETVEEICVQLKSLILEGASGFLVDASNVHLITTPGVQLLLSLERSLQQTNGWIYLVNATENFKESFKALGLNVKIDVWNKADATPANTGI